MSTPPLDPRPREPDRLPAVVPVAQAWTERHPVVDRARINGGRLTTQAALMTLGATRDRLDLYLEIVAPGCLGPGEVGPTALLRATLEVVATMAEIIVEDAGTENDWGRTTVDDLLAWEIVSSQTPSNPDGATQMSYSGTGATRHGWVFAAAGVSPTDLARLDGPVTYEAMATLAALRDIRIPALAPGEVFEPPSGVYVDPVQEVFRFPGSGRWWDKQRRLVGDPPPPPPA